MIELLVTRERYESPALASLEAFKAHYTGSRFAPSAWYWLRRGLWYGLAMYLHVRVPDGLGFFGPGNPYAGWTWPRNWYRRYYQARKAGLH